MIRIIENNQKILQADEGKILATYTNARIKSGISIAMPIDANEERWREFNTIEDAKSYYGLNEPTVDDMKAALNILGVNL